jgi:hypothetical protein
MAGMKHQELLKGLIRLHILKANPADFAAPVSQTNHPHRAGFSRFLPKRADFSLALPRRNSASCAFLIACHDADGSGRLATRRVC